MTAPSTVTVMGLARELLGYRAPDWVVDSRWESTMLLEFRPLARTLLEYAERASTQLELEHWVQEELLRYGWRHPLRDAGRLVDGTLHRSWDEEEEG